MNDSDISILLTKGFKNRPRCIIINKNTLKIVYFAPVKNNKGNKILILNDFSTYKKGQILNAIKFKICCPKDIFDEFINKSFLIGKEIVVARKVRSGYSEIYYDQNIEKEKRSILIQNYINNKI